MFIKLTLKCEKAFYNGLSKVGKHMREYGKNHLLLMIFLVIPVGSCEDGEAADDAVDDDVNSDNVGDDDDHVDTGGVSDSDSQEDLGDFSFFAMSIYAIWEFCGDEGCGGNLGGLDGADDMCQRAAAQVGAGDKKWVAFLSVTDYNGNGPVDAIDRVGDGPWYNVDGLLLAEDRSGLQKPRPLGDLTTIVYASEVGSWPFTQCLTDEFGDCTIEYGNSQDTLTGSDKDGRLFSTDKKYTCNDWTSADVNVQLPIGSAWNGKLSATGVILDQWIHARENCSGGSGGSCNGCAANINLIDSLEEGVGGCGGYGGFYCFADLSATDES